MCRKNFKDFGHIRFGNSVPNSPSGQKALPGNDEIWTLKEPSADFEATGASIVLAVEATYVDHLW